MFLLSGDMPDMPLSLHLSVHTGTMELWQCHSDIVLSFPPILSPPCCSPYINPGWTLPLPFKDSSQSFPSYRVLLSCSYPSIDWDPYCLSATWLWPWGRGVGEGGNGEGEGGGEYVNVCVCMRVSRRGGEEQEESRSHCKQHGIVWSF